MSTKRLYLFKQTYFQLQVCLRGEITQLTFYVLLTSQDQAGPLLQVLPHFLTPKSLFWCNLPLTTLSEYPLDSRFLLCILLYPRPSKCCFFFDFPLFWFFFLFDCYHHFFLITLFHLLLAHVFSLVFIDFILFKFSLCSSTSSMLFLWFSYGVFYFFLNSFWFFCSFLLTNAFSLDFLLSGFYFCLLEISGCIYALWLLFSSTI